MKSVALVAMFSAQFCCAMQTGGTAVLQANSTVFLSKFCFTFNASEGHNAGSLRLTLHAPKASALHQAHMVLFDDEDSSYTGPSSEWNAMTCEERLQHARYHEVISSSRAAGPKGEHITFLIKQKLRPRWWYVALLDCSESSDGLEVSYQMHMTNPPYGWASEFSTDRRLVLHVFLPLALAYGCLAAAQLHANRAVVKRAKDDSASSKAAHPFARILAAGILLALGDSLLSALHAVRYAHDGSGLPSVQLMAQLLAVTSNFVLASLLLLISQGKCVSYIMVAGDAWRMLRLLGPFLVGCLGLELWAEHSMRRHYTTDYVYTTPFGWLLILVDLVLLCIYLRNLRETYLAERERDDGEFYRTWGLFYGLWFLALPVTAVLAQAVLAPYVWFIVSLAVKKGTAALLYGALVVGLWPGNTRTHFKKLDTMVCSAASGAPLPVLLGSFLKPLPKGNDKSVRQPGREPSMPALSP